MSTSPTSDIILLELPTPNYGRTLIIKRWKIEVKIKSDFAQVLLNGLKPVVDATGYNCSEPFASHGPFTRGHDGLLS